MRYLLSTAGPALLALLPPTVNRYCCPAVHHFAGLAWSRPAHILPSPGTQSPLCRRTYLEEASFYPHPKKNVIKHPETSWRPPGGGKEFLPTPLLKSTSSWLWKMFSWVHHQSWKGFGSPPCFHLPFVFCFRHTLSSNLLWRSVISTSFQNNYIVLLGPKCWFSALRNGSLSTTNTFQKYPSSISGQDSQEGQRWTRLEPCSWITSKNPTAWWRTRGLFVPVLGAIPLEPWGPRWKRASTCWGQGSGRFWANYWGGELIDWNN